MRLTILNWNVWSNNMHLLDTIAFLKSQKADIVCLQEVPELLLKSFEGLSSYTLIHARDGVYKKALGMTPNFLAILVHERLQIAGIGTHQFKRRRKSSLWAWLFGLDRSLIAWFLGWKESLEFQHVDIRIPDKSGSWSGILRIFNAHLSSAVGPKTRRLQFREVLAHFHPGAKNIFCGDLNVLRLKKWWSPLYRLIIADSWEELWEKEHERFEELFEVGGLRSACNDVVTHRETDCHLDHILTQREVKCLEERVFDDTHGSDHNPLLVHVEP